ncbi:putative WD-40 repeat protein [Streptomyces himastatinicus ATCC 53653]|uniref:Putative WD-40 repeat protein n=1 Tax=Streptomyces himastatinicus ATCC 53653 TaxID=457427 RepID=D9WVA9_9ACTN|nr:helix-turn-helix domain-containing protein [Streptomyces himastatinicus]EFL20307.1 putative WD-40 repeat protein [Streptomyces himastatinicus ATCC 53653]
MGRPEADLDPGLGPVQRFAFELRKLRQEAGGITYRQMARQVEVSVSTLSRAAKGEQLPSLPVALAYVRACGGEEQAWERRWRETVMELARTDDLVADEAVPPPYRGLARFDVGDAELFFGRDEMTDALVRAVAEHRVFAVFGPSGSGKSSLLRAGLIPRLRSLDGPNRPAAVRILTPGEHPLRSHATVCVPAPGEGETWLVVDQFEEVFTLCRDTGERADFLARLLAAAEPGSRLRVVLGVRADFYGRCAEHRELADALREANLLVGPMSPAELREAVVRPAQSAGLIVERELTARLVEEVDGEPGGLPLLSHALRETWQRRRGRVLTMEAYEAVGGVHGAIAQSAEEVYTWFSPDHAELARLILLRLIAPGEGSQDTRRPVDRSELDLGTASQDDIALVLDRLARARLLTLDENTVDVAHEALISAWPRLRGWIEEAREQLRAHRRLTEAALAWDDLGRDPGALYRGTRLATAEEAFTQPGPSAALTVLEADFLTASAAARDQERQAAARAARRLRTLVGSLSAVVVLALLAGIVAWQQTQQSDRQRVLAAARRAATVANGLRSSDPRLALQLSVAAWELSHTPETESALLGALEQRERAKFEPPTSDYDYEQFLSDGGRTFTRIENEKRRITVWDAETGRVTGTYPSVPGHTDPEAFVPPQHSPDGATLAVPTGAGMQVRLWDIRAGRYRSPAFGPSRSATAFLMGFSSSGRAMFFSADDRGIEVWDTRTGRRLLSAPDAPQAVAADVSADGRLLAYCTEDDHVELRDMRQDRRPDAKWITKMPCSTLQYIQFSPDGHTLAVADEQGLRRWRLSSGKELPMLRQTGPERYAFSDDGKFVAGAGRNEILLWRLDRPQAPVFRHALADEYGVPGGIELDMSSRAIRYIGSGTGTRPVVHTLDLVRSITSSWRAQPLNNATFSADGSTLALAHAGARADHFTLLHARSGKTLANVPGLERSAQAGENGPFLPMSLSADGNRFAYGLDKSPIPHGADGIRVWDTRRNRQVTALTPGDADFEFMAVALSPDGREVMTTDAENRVKVWDTHSGKRLRTLPKPNRGNRDEQVQEIGALSADGTKLLTDTGALIRVSDGKTLPDELGECQDCVFAFSPDARRIAVAATYQGKVSLWDGTLRTPLGTLSGTLSRATHGAREVPTAMAFSPDGTTLAVAGEQGTLQLWDVASQQPLGPTLRTPGDSILSLAFSPDGGTLYAAGEHVPWQKYDIDPDRAVDTVCARAGTSLSPADWNRFLPEVPYRQLCRP